MQRFLHGWITEVGPLLHEVNAQQHLNRKRWPPFTPFGCIWRNQVHQLLPWQDLLHLLQECAFASFLVERFRPRSNCCMGRDAAAPRTHVQAHALETYADGMGASLLPLLAQRPG